MPHVNKKKPTSEKATLFKHRILITLKQGKKFKPQKSLAWSLHFLFRYDQNHYSNLTSKIKKMCEQILKKDSTQKKYQKQVAARKRKHVIFYLWKIDNCFLYRSCYSHLFERSFPTEITSN